MSGLKRLAFLILPNTIRGCSTHKGLPSLGGACCQEVAALQGLNSLWADGWLGQLHGLCCQGQCAGVNPIHHVVLPCEVSLVKTVALSACSHVLSL